MGSFGSGRVCLCCCWIVSGSGCGVEVDGALDWLNIEWLPWRPFGATIECSGIGRPPEDPPDEDWRLREYIGAWFWAFNLFILTYLINAYICTELCLNLLDSLEHASSSETSLGITIPAILDCFAEIFKLFIRTPRRIIVFIFKLWSQIIVHNIHLEVVKGWLL